MGLRGYDIEHAVDLLRVDERHASSGPRNHHCLRAGDVEVACRGLVLELSGDAQRVRSRAQGNCVRLVLIRCIRLDDC